MYLYQELTQKIIGIAITVHKELGPGFLEAVYEQAFAVELTRQKVTFQKQMSVDIAYHGHIVGRHRLDLIIENKVVVELKAIKDIEDVHIAIALSYLKATNQKVALIINFSKATIDVKRVARDLKFTAEAQNFRGAEKNLTLPKHRKSKDGTNDLECGTTAKFD